MQIKGRTCLVTGGSTGIGRGLAAVLLEDGANVVISARDAERLERTAGALGGGAALSTVAGDVASDEDAERMVEAAVSRFGGLDLLVNNAAILTEPMPIERVPTEVWNEVLRINVTGTANLVRHALAVMRRQGAGAIINLSSTWGKTAGADVAPYCASKFAVEGLTQSLAAEAPAGVIALALNPGAIATEMLARAFQADVSAYPGPDDMAPSWRRLLAALDSSWHGRSVDLRTL